MKRPILLAIGFFSFLFVVISPTLSGLTQSIPDRVQAVYDSTATRTKVPLMVPSTIPLNSQASPEEYWAFSIAPAIEAYSVSFNRAEDCTGVEECSFAMASGEVRTSTDQTLEYMLSRASVTGAERVSLNNGIEAVYVPAHRGLYMPSYLYWDIGRYRYKVGIYMGRKEDVLEMANSSL